MSKLMQEYLDSIKQDLIGYGADPTTVLTPQEWARLAEYNWEMSDQYNDITGELMYPMEPDQQALWDKAWAAVDQAREDYYRKHPSVDSGLVK